MFAVSVCFKLEKLGNTPQEWEDGAAARDGGDARFIVVDGATEAYDSARWVAQLVDSFVDAAPALDPHAMRRWFVQMQRQWVAEAPTRFVNVIEEHKFRQDGSFATLLGVAVSGTSWHAVALGDTVLFHVRNGRLLSHFPPMSVDEFGLNPDGVHTRPDAVDHMMRRIAFADGRLQLADTLYLATDALAHWMLRQDGPALWSLLRDLDHDAMFAALVADQRAAGQLRNDDVTLLRVRMVERQPAHLVVALR